MSLTVIEFQSWKGRSTNSRRFLGGGKTSTDLELEPYSLGQAEGPWEKNKGRSGLSLLQAQQRLFTRMCPGRFPNTSQVPSSGHRGSSARRQGRHRVGAGTAPAPPTAKRPPPPRAPQRTRETCAGPPGKRMGTCALQREPRRAGKTVRSHTAL